jgi:hypothetical protein
MAYIFEDWQKLLEKFQQCVDKGVEEMHQQKAEVQQIKTDIFNRLDRGAYYRNDQRIVISAPEIVIGNVDKSGALNGGEMGTVIIKGSDVALEGVGDTGRIVSRAPIIHQKAVNPGIDGRENVVCDMSEIVSQACDIVLHSSDARDEFSQTPSHAGRGGISLHADKQFNIEAAVSAERRKKQIEDTIKGLEAQSKNLKKDVEAQKKAVDGVLKDMIKLAEKEEKLNGEKDHSTFTNLTDISEVHEQMEALLPSVYHSTQTFIELVSELAEVNRRKKALEKEKGAIKTGDDFKKKSTGASMSVIAESISVATTDGDGNLHANSGAGISVRTPRMGLSMHDDEGALVKDGSFSVSAENITLNTVNPKDKGKEWPVEGKVKIHSKDISLEAIDYKMNDKNELWEKELTKDGKITMSAKTVEVSTANPKGIERDEKGKLSKGEYQGEGDVIIRSKSVTVESLDYEVKDGKLTTKALTKDSKLNIRTEKTAVVAADAEGKATGSINLNAKAVNVKSMDVDKEKLTDSKLAAGSTMTLVSEKMFVGAKSKDVKSKKIQAVSEEIGAFADKTLEMQQGDGKAAVQLTGGNAAVGGDKTQVYGGTTINGKTEVKDELKAPKVVGDSVEAKSAFKSPNISDGMGGGSGGGGGKLSTKLKSEDAPKES